MVKFMPSEDRNTSAHNLLRLIKRAGENVDVQVFIGTVKSVGPPLVFEIVGLETDIEDGDGVFVASDLLSWEEVVTIVDGDTVREQTIIHPTRLHVGTGIMALFDNETDSFFIFATY